MSDSRDIAAALSKLGKEAVSVDEKGRIFIQNDEIAELLAKEDPSLMAAASGLSAFIDNCACTTNNGCGKE